MPELTEQQQAALPVLEWLFSHNENSRRTGRTTIMALAYIRIAVSNPGRWIDVVDHYPAARGRLLHDAIMGMAEDLGIRDVLETQMGNRGCRIRVPSGVRRLFREEELLPLSYPTREESKAFKPPKPPPEPRKTLWDHLTDD